MPDQALLESLLMVGAPGRQVPNLWMRSKGMLNILLLHPAKATETLSVQLTLAHRTGRIWKCCSDSLVCDRGKGIVNGFGQLHPRSQGIRTLGQDERFCCEASWRVRKASKKFCQAQFIPHLFSRTLVALSRHTKSSEMLKKRKTMQR